MNRRIRVDLSCSTNSDWRLFAMLTPFACADNLDFLRGRRLLMMSSGQDGHRVQVPWGGFKFGWKYTTYKAVNKQGTKEHLDG